jgi:hypothetical protein
MSNALPWSTLENSRPDPIDSAAEFLLAGSDGDMSQVVIHRDKSVEVTPSQHQICA